MSSPPPGATCSSPISSAQAAVVEHAIRPAAIALALFGLVFAVTALLIVGQAATRLLATGSPDIPALAALGMTRGQLTAVGLVKVGVAAAIGAMVAAGVAVAASPLMPIGAAALAEPDPGVSADVVVLAAGAAAHRGAAGDAGGLAGATAGVRGCPAERRVGSDGTPVAVDRVAGSASARR